MNKEEAHPIIKWEDLPLGLPGRFVSPDQLRKTYRFIGQTSQCAVFQNTETAKILAGSLTREGLHITVDISGKPVPEPNIPLPNKFQVRMVEVSRGYQESGVTRDAYEIIATHITLISDKVQYWAARKLWNSIARHNHVCVYVWDTTDWMRNSIGRPIIYNGTNIDQDLIWGKTPEFANRLLVATTKFLSK